MTREPCGSTAPGALLGLVMDGLTGSGFDVRPPRYAESRRLAIAWPAARCTLTVSDGGYVEWEYCPRSPTATGPDLAADLVTTLLTGNPGPFPRLVREHGRENMTFKGVVGRELMARGLDVELAVYQDGDFFDTAAEIVATASGIDQDAKLCVTDQGIVTWVRDYSAETTPTSGPGLCGQITGPASVTASVVGAITRAMTYLRPGTAGGPAHA